VDELVRLELDLDVAVKQRQRGEAALAGGQQSLVQLSKQPAGDRRECGLALLKRRGIRTWC
jgi:hypothetical protein